MSHILVFDLGGTKCDWGVFTLAGDLVQQNRFLTIVSDGQEGVLNQLTDCITEQKTQFQIKAVVIGLPGVIAADQKTVINAPNLPGFQNLNIVQIFRQKFPELQILIENDTNLFALGEYGYLESEDKKKKNLIGITLGTGIGSGIICDGRILRGPHGLSGEIGHMVIVLHGKSCFCGQQGCLEAYASSTALIRRIQEKMHDLDTKHFLRKQPKIYMEIVKRALQQEDPFTNAILKEIVFYLGVGLANMIKTLDPDVIVLGGSLGKLLDFYQNQLKEEIEGRLLGQKLKCEICKTVNENSQLEGGVVLFKSFNTLR